MSKKEKYDLIVIGAGSGGCAITKVASEKGLKVLLIDKRKKDDIGDKLTFDTIPAYVFKKFGIPTPEGEELDFRMKKLKVFSPNKKYCFEADVDAYLIHRGRLGQRLLKYAQDAGCDLLAETEVIEPLIENNFIVGVKCKLADESIKEFRGSVTCDASGFEAVIRNKLPHEVYHNEKLLPEDTVVCYREVRDLIGNSEYTPPADYPGWYCYLQNRGYFWVVPEEKGKVNVGCGLPLFSGHLDPKDVTIEFCESNPQIFGDKIYAKGTGPTPFIPVRADQPELVGNGFVLVGDSGYQVSTNSAYGVPSSLLAGKIAADVIARAIKEDDVSREGLWKYNVLWKRGSGGSFRAFADGIRLLIQNMTHEDINILIKTRIMGPKEFSALWSDRTFDYNIFEMIRKFLDSLPYLKLLLRVYPVFLTCKRLNKLYKNFPEDIHDFNSWMNERENVYSRLFKILGIKRGL
ncbi:MAG: NAD(P)/FAD-dependent oxidoreductase [Thermodesulfobacteriota bacterium]|nr:NAD(P)/FAD-dependent oxidoreductase [Thermodesulfobacteriota bacterium]